MTAFGGSGELAQGPGSGLPQLQPGQNGAAAATIPVERELSPWRPAAGQAFRQGLGPLPITTPERTRLPQMCAAGSRVG